MPTMDETMENVLAREATHISQQVAQSADSFLIVDKKRELIGRYAALQPLRHNNPAMIYGLGYSGLGNTVQESGPQRAFKLIYRTERPRPIGRSTPALRTRTNDRANTAYQKDELVPIRIDVEYNDVRLRDTFTWNLNDRTTPLELFARCMVEDFRLSLPEYNPLVQLIQNSIREQIQDYHPHLFCIEEPTAASVDYVNYRDDEIRVLVKLAITIKQHTLMDQFEWNLNQSDLTPEDFARQLSLELSLSGEFTTAIAHSIREQCQLFTRSLYGVNYPFDGRLVEDSEIQANLGISPLPSSFRPFQAAKDFTPYLYEMNETELEKTEVALSRDERRQKRSVNRRGGPILPDLKERKRTVRTLLVSSTLPSAVRHIDESRLMKRNPNTRMKRTKDGSDESDSDESLHDPSNPHGPQGSIGVRTRVPRGAAAVASAALKNLNRSITPEMMGNPQEVRSVRRGREVLDSSSPEPPGSLLLKLKLPSSALRRFLPKSSSAQETLENHSRTNLSNAATPLPSLQSTTDSHTEPAAQNTSIKAPRGVSRGRMDAPGPGEVASQPPPPQELMDALQELRNKYPLDDFQGTMKYIAVAPETDEIVQNRPGNSPSANRKYYWYPRIKCNDCPGKLYTPDMDLGVNNFEVHLKNRHHRERVTLRKSGKS